jgi:ActR/RegA family two-component response regulator
MKTSGKYAIFYCDQCELLAGVIKLMVQLYPDVEVRMASDIGALLGQVERQLPEYILVYLTINDESHISVVKSIRESVNTSNTPVVIYQALPGELELRKLSGRFI